MAAFRQNRVFLMPPDLPETAVLAATSGDSQQPAFCFARVEVKSNVKVNFIDTQEVPELHRFLVSAAAIADLIVTHVQRFFADLQEAKTLEQALVHFFWWLLNESNNNFEMCKFCAGCCDICAQGC
jgi:hypothetical protein